MISRRYGRTAFVLAMTFGVITAAPFWAVQPFQTPIAQPAAGRLPLPHTLPLAEYETLLYDFLGKSTYRSLGWTRDKRVNNNGVRDTGDYWAGVDYSTHHAVRIFYSPEVIAWLKGGRVGPIPDGAMIVKEQFPPPAARYAGLSDDKLDALVTERTVMVRDAAAATDGWFWADYFGQPVDTHETMAQQGFSFPWSGFGQYCIRCHSSAERDQTFTAARNIAGFPGVPLVFKVDGTWKPAQGADPQVADAHRPAVSSAHGVARQRALREAQNRPKSVGPLPPNGAGAARALFPGVGPVRKGDFSFFPDQTYDRLHAVPGGYRFLDSGQCMSCHSGMGTPNAAMFVDRNDGALTVPYQGPGVNLSPYGEWRFSLMGLAGRDPVTFAQIETEVNLFPMHKDTITNTCFSCHGAMGQRQHQADVTGNVNYSGPLPPAARFRREFVGTKDPATGAVKEDPRYGPLARDGISCMVCHRIDDAKPPLEDIITGQFKLVTKPEVLGPYPDGEITPYHMKAGLGITPRGSDAIRSSRLCASCHVIRLPVFDKAGKQVKMAFEQATYLEWLNSSFDDETRPATDQTRSCQQCHMPNDYQGMKLRQRVAVVEDPNYPKVDNRATDDRTSVRFRDRYARHELLGINLFVMQMFNQFNDVLGVNTTQDFMTGSTTDLDFALSNAAVQAGRASADVKLVIDRLDLPAAGNPGRLSAKVTVVNKTGHRFPSGVGFRRAFLEFLVIDTSSGTDRVVWGSGRTNGLGVILDGSGVPLPSESFKPDPRLKGPGGTPLDYQPHYETVDEEFKVQIFQELAKNPEGAFTTSFLAIDRVPKDNRILPRGWEKDGLRKRGLPPLFWEATDPHGNAADDPQYRDGKGTDVVAYDLPLTDRAGKPLIPSGNPDHLKVVATLYYQSIPPFYLQQRFRDAKGDDTKRLHYLTSNLQLDGTGLESWKLRIAQDGVQGRPSK